MPITDLVQDPDTREWQFRVLDESGNVLQTSRPYKQRYGASKGARYFELKGTMPTMSRPMKGVTTPWPAAKATRRLSDDDVRDIRNSTEMARDLAARYGVSKAMISMIKARTRRQWVQD